MSNPTQQAADRGGPWAGRNIEPAFSSSPPQKDRILCQTAVNALTQALECLEAGCPITAWLWASRAVAHLAQMTDAESGPYLPL
jgi:hypothetical protein